MSNGAIDWPTVIVAAVLATSAGTRLVGWLWARRRWVLLVARVLEQLVHEGGSAGDAVLRLNASTDVSGGELRDFADRLAARAEALTDSPGSATRRRRLTRLARWGRALARWLPIVGALL